MLENTYNDANLAPTMNNNSKSCCTHCSKCTKNPLEISETSKVPKTSQTSKPFDNLYKILTYGALVAYLLGLGVEFEILPLQNFQSWLWALYLVCYLILGAEILKEALLGFYRREMFNENSLMAIASLGAWAIGDGAEAVAILAFYRLGEALEARIVEDSKRSITSLATLKIQKAKILKDNQVQIIPPSAIQKDDICLVAKGDRIPADGVIIKGESLIDNSALNGESLPINVKVGDFLLSGGINLEGALEIRAIKSYQDSTFSKILKLISEGSLQKSKSEEFITKFARFYTPIVTFLALSLMILPPLYLGLTSQGDFWGIFTESFWTWLYRGLIFLVVSCPCALVISIPLTFFAALGAASKAGILIKGSSYLETLHSVDTLVFDKTGTLTKGTLTPSKIQSFLGFSPAQILTLAKLLEQNSSHPIAKAILNTSLETAQNLELSQDSKIPAQTLPKNPILENLKEVSGGGICAEFEGKVLALGNANFIQNFLVNNIPNDANTSQKCQIFLSYNQNLIGIIDLEDEIKEEAKSVLEALKDKTLIMLSGDRENVAQKIAKELGITQVFAELLPQNKVEHLKAILQKTHQRKKKVAFIGDGINDAPSLSLSDVGIAMGKNGSDIALEGADIVILNDNLAKIPKALQIAKKTRQILWQNIGFALGVKVLIMICGALGLANLWIALFGDVGVAFLALLNALRALR